MNEEIKKSLEEAVLKSLERGVIETDRKGGGVNEYTPEVLLGFLNEMNENDKLEVEKKRVSSEEFRNRLELRKQNIEIGRIIAGGAMGLTGVFIGNHMMNKSMVFEETGCFRTAASRLSQRFTEPFIKMWSNHVLMNLTK